MRRSPRSPLALLVWGALLALGSGCEPVDLGEPGISPPSESNRTCYTDADCTGNACCGLGTRPTHVKDGPDCSGVRCGGECRPDGLECGRCLVICRESRCAAACQG